MGIYIDARANAEEREAPQMIFGGQAGGWPGEFAQVLGELRGIEYAHIDYAVAKDLASWRAVEHGSAMVSASTGSPDLVLALRHLPRVIATAGSGIR